MLIDYVEKFKHPRGDNFEHSKNHIVDFNFQQWQKNNIIFIYNNKIKEKWKQ